MKLIVEDYDNTETLITESDESGKKDVYIEGIFAQAELKNRNGRIYPKPVMKGQVDSYIKEKVNKNRALGELDHPQCYFYDDFQILTEHGWKDFNDIAVGDLVYSVNDENKFVLNKVLDIIKEEYKGKGFHIKGRNIDSVVTPTHRFYLLDRYGNKTIKTAQEIYDAKDTTNIRKHRIIKCVDFDGDKTDTITIPGIKGLTESEVARYKNNVSEDLVIDTKTFVQFLGFWLAEGCVSKTPYGIHISQNEGKVADKIRKVLNKLPFDINESVEIRKYNKHIRFSFSDRRLWEYLSKLGKAHEKFIPHEIKQLDPEYLWELVLWFALGDGRSNKYGSKKRNKYPRNIFSTSKQLIDDLQECLVKSGYSGNITTILPEKDYIFADHLIKAENKKPLYVLNISMTSGIYLDNRHSVFDITEVESTEDSGAFCITTEHGNFYIRDNNKIYLTGNSAQINPDRICHKITELKWINENDVYGKAKLTHTPKGNLVRNLVIEDGVILGVSTRGLGSVKSMNEANIVQNDFRLICWDVVTDPSAPDAFVNGIMEGKEWIIEDGVLVEKDVEELQKKINKESAKVSLNKDRWNDIFNEVIRKL